MAGRIRTIKPELLEDEKTSGLDNGAWRLFVSLLLVADDHGNFRAHESFLHSQVFWSVNAVSAGDVGEWLQELEACGLVMLYEVRGQRYGHLCGWKKHQRVDHPGKGRVPPPDGADVFMVHPDTWTYFFQAGSDEPIKIGKSWNPEKRLKQVQNGYPRPLRLLAKVRGDLEVEIHCQFKHIRGAGEWFSPDPELLRYIAEIASNPPAAPASPAVLEEPRETPRESSRLTTDPDPDPDLDHERDRARAHETRGVMTQPTGYDPADRLSESPPPPDAPEVAAIVSELSRHRSLTPIATRNTAEMLEGRRMASGKPLPHVLAAIGELGADAIPGWSAEVLRRKARAYCDRAGPPRAGPVSAARRSHLQPAAEPGREHWTPQTGREWFDEIDAEEVACG